MADFDPDGPASRAQLAAGFAMCHDLMLDREDRLALSEVVLSRDVASWNDLTWAEMSKLLTALNGYVQIRHLRLERRR